MRTKATAPASSQALDLDALYGHSSQPRSVKFGDQVYELRSLDAFGPLELMQFQRLVSAMRKLPRELMAAMNAGQAPAPKQKRQTEEMVKTVDNLVQFICPDLPLTNLPFAAKLQVINFFYRGTGTEATTSKKVTSRRTGAGSTRGSRTGTA
jgi:hypothetical protein